MEPLEIHDLKIGSMELVDFVEVGQAMQYLMALSGASTAEINAIDGEIGRLKTKRNTALMSSSDQNSKEILALTAEMENYEKRQERLKLYVERLGAASAMFQDFLLDQIVPPQEKAEKIIEKIAKKEPKKQRKRPYKGQNEAKKILDRLEEEGENNE